MLEWLTIEMQNDGEIHQVRRDGRAGTKANATAFALTVAIVTALPTMAAHAQTPGLINWNGFSVGALAGGGSGRSSQTDPGIPAPAVPVCLPPDALLNGVCVATADGRYSVRGGSIGAAAGYDWQRDRWVMGLLTDYSGSNIKGGSPVCGGNHFCGTSLESFGTVRGRVGYALDATGAWLPYLTGGYAFGSVFANDALTPASGRNWRNGWTLGGGIEKAFSPAWSAKLEYLYIDLGRKVNFDVVPGVPETVSLTSSMLRVGVNYRFGR